MQLGEDRLAARSDDRRRCLLAGRHCIRAANGTLQSPSRRIKNARSAAALASASAQARAATSCEMESSLRPSIARIPCATAGNITSVEILSPIRSDNPSRSSPALASTTASSDCSSILRNRVGTFPRSGTISRSGRYARSSATRRTLPVPTRAPSRRPASVVPGSRPTSASRGSARSGNAMSDKPSGTVAGRSFALCTAMSARPPRSASSISFTKRPLPPIFASDTSWIRSPVVLIVTNSTSTPSSDSMRAAIARDCVSARSLPRVASRIVLIRSPNRRPQLR